MRGRHISPVRVVPFKLCLAVFCLLCLGLFLPLAILFSFSLLGTKLRGMHCFHFHFTHSLHSLKESLLQHIPQTHSFFICTSMMAVSEGRRQKSGLDTESFCKNTTKKEKGCFEAGIGGLVGVGLLYAVCFFAAYFAWSLVRWHYKHLNAHRCWIGRLWEWLPCIIIRCFSN